MKSKCVRFEDEPETEQMTYAGHTDYSEVKLGRISEACDRALTRRGVPNDWKTRKRMLGSWAGYQRRPFDKPSANL